MTGLLFSLKNYEINKDVMLSATIGLQMIVRQPFEYYDC
jgi:hypothetical protein